MGECRTAGIGVERSTMSSENSLSCAGFIKDSDSVRVLGVVVAGSINDQDVYSRSWMWTRYVCWVVIFALVFVYNLLLLYSKLYLCLYGIIYSR